MGDSGGPRRLGPPYGFAGFKIGIAWQGNPRFGADRQRSFPLALFETLARLPGVRLFSLQKNDGTEQLRDCPFPVVNLGPRLDEANGPFMDTAAVMQCLDLVICPNTALAHLAGALGVPVWLPLALAPEWRWLWGRADSPWYPTARLFRQERAGDWTGVFARLADLFGTREEKRQFFPRPSSLVPRPSQTVRVAVSPGELLDKISILQIKSERLSDQAKLKNVRRELASLEAVRDRALASAGEVAALAAELKAVNEALWEVEDRLRQCERVHDFGPDFVELARSVYRHNDRRTTLKRRANELLGSSLSEEKDYTGGS